VELVMHISKKHILKVSLMVQGSLKTIFDFMGPLIIKRSRTTDLNELAFNHRLHFRVNCIYGSYGSSMAAN
jgi:hypothetical protein